MRRELAKEKEKIVLAEGASVLRLRDPLCDQTMMWVAGQVGKEMSDQIRSPS